MTSSFFELMLPHLTSFLEVTKRCGFMSEGMKDLNKLNEEELETLHHMAAVFAGQDCDLSGRKIICRRRKIGNSGAKVVAEALKSSTTARLYLADNEIGDQGAEALAESLKSNGSLKSLWLEKNNIGDSGAEALAESLKSNGSLKSLWLEKNNIGDSGAEALAESLKSHRSLDGLRLEDNSIGDRGAEALAEGLKENCSLELLFLNNNCVGDAGAQALAAGLEQNRGLRGFHLSKMDSSLWHGCCPNDAIGHQGSQALDEAEKKKKKRGDNFVMYWNSDQSHRLKTVHNS